MDYKLRRIDRELASSGKVLEFYRDTVELPDGHTERWDFVHHKKGGGACVVPVLPDGRILMIHQYRPAVNRETAELPAGAFDLTVSNPPYFEQSGGHLQGSYSLFSSDELLTETDVSSMLLTGEITDVTDKGDQWAFRVLPERADMVEKTVCQCVAEKQTLALDEVVLTMEDGDVIRHTIEHSPSLELNDFGLLDGLEKPYRTVRICTLLHDETGREQLDSVTCSVPYNLELIPTLDREVQLYGDEALTKSYVYPGNGKDYTIWVTDAMG